MSWVVVAASLTVLTVAFGAPLVVAVAMKPIAAGLNVPRSVPALAGSATFIGSGVGGILMGWVAERFGARRLAAFGILMIGAGMWVSAQGSTATLLVGQGLMVGFLGMACLFAPLVTLVSRWFDRRRGTALALVASGQYLSGMLWTSLLEWAVERFGWQQTMLTYGALAVLTMLPVCLLLRPAPKPVMSGGWHGPAPGGLVLGWPPAVVGTLIPIAIFLCCVPMAMPPGHLVAFCSDIGLSPARGAAMMSVMLGVAFAGRQLWGWMADRVGGLTTALAGSSVQAVALVGFLVTRDETMLFVASAVFGMGFSGLVPAYVMAIRELFPDREAAWRVPVLLLAGQGGMAVGSWMAGAVYDQSGAYGAAFAVGMGFNLVNLVLLGLLAGRRPRQRLVLA